MKIVFGPVVAPAAWAIGESLLPSYANVERVARGEAPLWLVPELRA